MNQNPSIISTLPILLLTVCLVIVSIKVAIQKGKSPVKYGFLALLPIANMFCFLYLISQTNLDVSEKLDQIIDYIENNQTKIKL